MHGYLQTPMRVYTTQTVAFYDELMRNGIVYCDRESWMAERCRVQYDWMAQQMRQRIGEPPLPQIKYPLWVWYQYTNKKSPAPTMSSKDIEPGETQAVMIELEVPDNAVLLSDFTLWHLPLNCSGICLKREKRQFDAELEKYQDLLREYRPLNEYPREVQQILKTWERIFDLDMIDPYLITKRRENRCIQGTIWQLRKEWVKIVHFFNKYSEIKRIEFA